MQVPNINATPEGKKLIQLMAQGLLDYLKSQGKELSNTYEEFEKTVVQESRDNKFEGAICFLSPNAQRAFLELVGLPADVYNQLREAPKLVLNNHDLFNRLVLSNMIGTGQGVSNEQRADGIEKLGEGFKPVADSFRIGFCQRKAVYEAAKLIKEESRQ